MSITDFLRDYRKRKIIGLYLSRLAPVLKRLYGKSRYYTPDQVKQAAQQAKLPMDNLCYGLSIYCTPAEFDNYHTANGEECSYWEMRVEVAEHHFHGNANFTPQDVAACSDSAGHSHIGGDGEGHHFGGDSGHHGGH